MLKITSPNGTVCLYTKSAQDYLQNGGDVAKYFNEQLIESNQAIPVFISWETDKPAHSFTVKYSENKSFENYQTVVAVGNANSVEVYNLLKATTYYVEISALYTDGTIESATHTFSTMEKGPRPLKIDGIFNTRDIGGYLLSNGKRTKQNKIFRGGALSPCKDSETIGLTGSGRRYMSEVLGIKTEIDFRGREEAQKGDDSEIPNATLFYTVLNGYDAIINHAESCRQLFSILADEKNYPVYLHCTGGADRTGTVCYLINALLGVDEQTLIEDYEFTTFSYYTIRSSKSGWTQPLWEKFTNLLNTFEGNSVNEKVENLLLSIGVEKKDLNSLRKIMIG